LKHWVNSLVEEGHDLSEYTWEDMYEAYIEEQGSRSSRGVKDPAVQARLRGIGNTLRYGNPQGRTTPIKPSGREQMRQKMQQSRPSSSPKPQIASLPSSARQVTQYPQGVSTGVGGGNAGASRPPTPASRPAPTPAARPAPTPAPGGAVKPTVPTAAAAAPTAQSKPTPTATPATTTAPTTTPAAPQRSFNPLMQRTFGYQTGYAPSQVKQDPKKMAQMGSLRSISSSFDPFDVVQGYLIDEGYAETEEAASVIMANMSEEWKESILESGYFPTRESQMKDEAKHNLRGQAVKPRTAQTQAKPTPSNLK
jgi:hypothetical protein